MAAPVSSAAPGCVKKKTTTLPLASALMAGSVLRISGETAGFGGVADLVVACGLVAARAAAFAFSAALGCVAGTDLCALAAACLFALAGLAGVCLTIGLGCDGSEVTVLPVSFAERVARKAAAHSASPRIAMSTGRGRVITPCYRHGLPACLAGAENYPRAASRITSSGGATLVQRSKLSAPWRTSTSRPSTTRAPPARAHVSKGVSRPYTSSTATAGGGPPPRGGGGAGGG